jgi:hypothetical protein
MNDAFKAWVEKHQIGPGMNDNTRRAFYEKYSAERGLSSLPAEGLYSGFDGSVGPGWVPILDRLAGDLMKLGWTGGLQQVKEKFGGLRFYIRYDGIPEDRHEAARQCIREAEAESYTTCEDCGAPGSTGPRPGRRWILTLCDACRGGPLTSDDIDA